MGEGDKMEGEPLKGEETQNIVTEPEKAEEKATTPAPVTPAEPAAAPANTATVSVSDESPKKKAKFTLPKVKLDVKCKVKKGTLPEPALTPKYFKDVDYSNRDPDKIHDNIRVNFKDVIAEPDGAHSFATVWGTSFKSYSVVKYWTYRILTAVLAVPISVFWGLYFALFAFCSIWCLVPCIKGFVIWTNFIGKIWGLIVRTFLDPLFESIGLCFTNIRVHLQMSTETVNAAPVKEA